MTTIAWDGRTLAADTQLTGTTRKLRSRKLWRIERQGKTPLLFGFAGKASHGIKVRDWIIAGMKADEKPHVPGIEFLIVDEGRVIEMDMGLVPIEVFEPFYGIGSGSDYAMGAMASGKSAKEAIEIAARFDPNTNALIEEINADPKVTKARSKS